MALPQCRVNERNCIVLRKLNVYFSTITFTSLGYGDILPVSDVARLLLSADALLGVFMIPLFVLAFCRRMEL